MPLRLLLTSHDPLGQGLGGQEVLRLARGLVRWGHRVRVVAADSGETPLDGEPEAAFSVRRVVCRPGDPTADVQIPLPRFETGAEGVDFCRLGESHWQCYEDRFRQVFRTELDRFDPQIIHCQYAWIHADLALETGVPYVISVWGPELEAAHSDPRFQRLVEQTTVGAGRLLVPDPGLAYRLPPEARRSPGRVVPPPLHREDDASFGARMSELYLSVLEAWFGA